MSTTSQELLHNGEEQIQENNKEKWRESTAATKVQGRHHKEEVKLKESELEEESELRNILLAQQLVQTVQLRAIASHSQEREKELEKIYADKPLALSCRVLELEQEVYESKKIISQLLIEKSLASAKILDVQDKLCQETSDKLEKIEFDKQLVIEEVTQRLIAEYKDTLNSVVDTYHRQTAELQREHVVTLTHLEKKMEHEQEQREYELETTVCKELSQVSEEIEERLTTLEMNYKEKETNYIHEIHQLKVELLKERELFQAKRVEAKERMASLVKEKESIAKRHKEGYERLQQDHQIHIQQMKAQLQTATLSAEQHHLEDSQTLQALHTHLQQVQQERNALQTALLTLYSSVTSLLPITHANSSDISDHSNTLTPPTTQWTSPIHMTANMTTPTNPSHKVAKTVGTGDSGLASQQTSIGKPHSTNNGSIIQSLRPEEATPTNSNDVIITIPPTVDLSISQLQDDEDDYPLQDNLTIMSLNSSTEAIPTWEVFELDTPTSQSVQAMISQLYQSVSQLVNSFLSSSTQVYQYQHDLAQTQEELISSQTNLTNQLTYVQQLQSKVESLQNELVKHETKESDLKSARENISLLISEINMLQKNRETTTILSEGDSNQTKEVQQQNVKSLEEDKRNIIDQVSLLERELLLSTKERDAQRDSLQNLQEKMERVEVQYRNEAESLRAKERKLIDQVKERNVRILELEDLPSQLIVRQQKEEELQETIKELTSQLTNALYRSALAESATDLQQQLDNYQHQVEKQKERYDDLLKTYEGSVISLTCASEELDRDKMTREKLQREIERSQREIQVKDSEIQQLITIRDEAQGQCDHLHQQISTLASQVDNLTTGLVTSSEQVSKLCHSLEEKDTLVEEMSRDQANNEHQLEELQGESDQHLKAFEQSVLQVQSLKDELMELKVLSANQKKVTNSMKTAKVSLENEMVDLQKKLIERDEQYQLQIDNIQSEMSTREQEMKLLYQQKLSELEDRLQAEHTGQQALMRLQLKELSSTVGNDVLQQLAQVTPTLEQDAQEVLQLCQVESSLVERLQLASNEAIKSLNDTNDSLRHDMSLADNSMRLANSTLSALQIELEESKKRETVLQQQLLKQSTEATKILANTEREFEAHLAAEKCQGEMKLAGLSQRHEELMQAYKTLDQASQKREEELQRGYQLLQQELQLAHSQGLQSNQALEENIKLVQKLLQQLEVVKRDQSHGQQVDTLREALETKENELSQTVDQFLEEKLKVARLRGEKSNLQSRLHSPEKTTIQLQTLDQNVGERFVQERASLEAALQCTEAKCHRLALLVRKADRRCKSLVFQKRYLNSELDAYYHTHQAALLMIQDMGGLPWQPPTHHQHTISTNKKHKFKRVALVVLAAMRLQLLSSRRRSRRTRNGHIPVASQIVHYP